MEIFNLFINIIESFSIYLFIFLSLKGKKWCYVFLFSALDCLNTSIHNYFNLPELSLTLSCLILMFIYASSINKNNYLLNLLLALYTYTVIALTTSFILMIFYFLNISFPYINSGSYIISTLLIKSIDLFYFIIAAKYINKYDILKTKKFIFLFACFFILLCMNSIISDLIFSYQILNIYTMLLNFFVCLLMISISFIFVQSKKEQSEYLKLQNDILKFNNQINIQKINKTNMLELNKIVHDIKYVLQVIKYYLDKEKKEEIYKIINKYSKNLAENNYVVKTGFELLDYILIEKNDLLKKYHIETFITCQINYCPLKDEHFFMILGNLIDNAIENCSSNYIKQIKINIGEYQNNYYIKIQNSISKPILKNNPNLKSTKNNSTNHGYGIKNITSLIKKYNGIIDFSEDNYFFIVKIIIPLFKTK